MRKHICWALALLTLTLLANCSTVQRAGPSMIPSEQLHAAPPADVQALWEKAEQQQRAGNSSAAISLWEQIARSYPNNAIAARAFYRAGDAYLREGQVDRSLQYFDYVLYAYPQWNEVDLARVGQLRAWWLQGNRKRVEKEAAAIWETSPSNQEVRFQLAQLMVNVCAADDEIESGFGWAATGFAAAATDQQKKSLTQATVSLLGKANEKTVQKLLQTNPNEFMRLFLEYRLAQIKLEKQPSDANREALYALLQKNPRHPLAMEIQTTLRGTAPEVALPLNANRIGVLIPLNGTYQTYGNNVLRGVSLAEHNWNRSHPDQQVTVIVKDTQAEPELSRKSFEDLAKNEGVLAIIGPLGVKPAQAVFPLANKWNVPLLALSQKDEESGNNPYVLHAFIDNRDMVEDLVRFCREKYGYSKFATLYPNDRYGQRLSKDFAAAVQAKGGSLLASVPYEANTTDFKGPIQKLMDIAKKNSPPAGVDVTPFEALFIPDQAQTVALIAPQLPYNNVVGVTLLGTNLWGETPLAQVGGAFVENAVYATPFFAEAQSGEVQSFAQEYTHFYGTAPTYLDAQAYDAMMLLLNARSTLGSSSIQRSAVLEKLLGTHDYRGVTGTSSFTPDGRMQKSYLVLQIKNGKTVQISP